MLYEALEEIRVFISQLVNLSLFAFTDIGKVFLVCECGFVDEVVAVAVSALRKTIELPGWLNLLNI